MERYEKRLYQDNVIGYNFILGFIALNTIYCIFVLKNMSLDYKIGVFIILNIVLSLVSFLSAAKAKKYSILWSYLTFGIGIFQFARYFIEKQVLASSLTLNLSIVFIASIVSIFIGSIVSILRSNKRKNYIRLNNIDVELVSNKGDLR